MLAGRRSRRVREEEAAGRAADRRRRRPRARRRRGRRRRPSRCGSRSRCRPSRSIKDDAGQPGTSTTINKNSPFQPVFFALRQLRARRRRQQVLNANAEVLKKYPTWVITIEGHCDERGTAEYNLALGERRALAARNYLVSLGIPADRLRTVSYGKEFPFDPGHDEAAWSKNRRAHFVVTSK